MAETNTFIFRGTTNGDQFKALVDQGLKNINEDTIYNVIIQVKEAE